MVMLWSVLCSGAFHYCRVHKLITCCIVKISQDVSLLNSNSSEISSLLICAAVKHSACYRRCLSFKLMLQGPCIQQMRLFITEQDYIIALCPWMKRAVYDRVQNTGFKVSPTMY